MINLNISDSLFNRCKPSYRSIVDSTCNTYQAIMTAHVTANTYVAMYHFCPLFVRGQERGSLSLEHIPLRTCQSLIVGLHLHFKLSEGLVSISTCMYFSITGALMQMSHKIWVCMNAYDLLSTKAFKMWRTNV